METDGRGCVVTVQTRDRKPLPYSNAGQLGQLLRCVAEDPVLSQPSALPRCQCDSKAHLELQVVASPYEGGFPLQASLQREEIYPSRKPPADLPVWLIGQGKVTCFPYANPCKGNRDDHDLSRTIPRLRGPGTLHLNTSKKETGAKRKAFHRMPVFSRWCSHDTGCGLPEGRILSPHQPVISERQCLSQTRNPGRTGAVFSPKNFHKNSWNINEHPFYVYLL